MKEIKSHKSSWDIVKESAFTGPYRRRTPADDWFDALCWLALILSVLGLIVWWIWF